MANVIGSRCRSEPTKLRFVSLSACTAGVAEVKEAVAKAKNELSLFNRQTVLFIDEVHRFNKLQQVNFCTCTKNTSILDSDQILVTLSIKILLFTNKQYL